MMALSQVIITTDFHVYSGLIYLGIIVGDPDLIKQIMVKDFHIFTNRRPVKTSHPIMSKFLSSLVGEEWKRVRSIVTPTFTSSKMKKIFHIMKNSSSDMLDKLEQVATRTNNEIDLKELYGDYTMDIIAKCAFATHADSNFVKNATKLFTFPFWRKFLDYAVPMWLLDSLKFTVLPPNAMDFFRSITVGLINQRLDTGQHHDFLELLMNARKLSCDEISASIKDIDDATFKKQTDDERKLNQNALTGITNSGGSKKLDENEILAQSVLFFSVGFETSSQLLAYCTYCLALNPDCQEKLHDEIEQILNSNHGQIDYDIVSKMNYLDAVISETLRLYNPVLRMERQASEDYILGSTGIVIEKGMIVGIPVWALHHDPQYYPNPYTFDPERFSVENRERIVPYTYLPFGAGPRNCIGTRFALLETKIALIKVLSNYRFIQSKGTKIPLRFLPVGRPLLRCEHVAVGVEKRF
jgi:cytochrome P450